jgi:RNase P/RNase MRP subunit POP5
LLKRVRRRYLAIKIESSQATGRDVYNAILDSILKLFGEYGASQTDLRLIDYDPENMQAVLRCSHDALPLVRASIPCVTRVGNEPASLHVQLISGTLKSLRRKLAKTSGTREDRP